MTYSQIIFEASKILFGALLGTIFTTWYNGLKSKKREQRELFRRLVAAKGYATLPQAVIDDMNMIEILFRGHKKVIEKYRIYYADLCVPVADLNLEKQNAHYWDLLRVMGNVVGYKNLDNKTLNDGYLPQGSLNEYNFVMNFRQEVIPYLKKMAESAEKAIPLHEVLLDFYKNQAESKTQDKEQPPQ